MRSGSFGGEQETGGALRPRRKPERAREILKGLIWRWGLGPRFVEQLVCRVWGAVAGEEGAGHSRVKGVRGGVVVVAADSASAAQLMGLRKVQLLAGLREALAREVGRAEAERVVQDLKFVSQGWARPAKGGGGQGPASARGGRKQAAAAGRLSAAEKEHLEELLAEVGNEEVRGLLRRGLSGLMRASSEKGGMGKEGEG